MPKIYAVHYGRDGKQGLFSSWEGESGARKWVSGVRGAIYKSFDAATARADAERFMKEGAPKPQGLTHSVGAANKLETTLEWRSPGLDKHAETFANSGQQIPTPLVINCDGSCAPKSEVYGNSNAVGSIGTWAACVGSRGDKRNLKGVFPFPNPTSQRCELFACYKALKCCLDTPEHFGWRIAEGQTLVIRTDSTYTVKQLAAAADSSGQFRAQIKCNSKLIDDLATLAKVMPVHFVYVPGHVGDEGNEAANSETKDARPSTVDETFV